MVATASRALVAPLARRRTQLQEKAKYRPEKKIARRLPAGAGALAKIPKGKDFKRAGRKQTDITAYCKAVRGATETFKDSHRAMSTAVEHDMYMNSEKTRIPMRLFTRWRPQGTN